MHLLNRLSDLVRLRTFGPQVRPVGRVEFESLADLGPGDHVHARIDAAMPDGTFRATIGNQSLVLRLPLEARAGDLLELKVIAREPQLKFTLAAAADLPEPHATLSETARFITALIGESEKLPVTAGMRGGAPLFSAPPTDVGPAAAVLRDALHYCGLFYEAHQAQWIGGTRSLADIKRERQAALAPLAVVEPREDGSSISRAATDVPQLPVHRDALAMVKQQLDTLESGTIAWHGAIWAGQLLEWEIIEDAEAAPAAAESPRWRTCLRLTLPRLGKIAATLCIDARGVAITLCADAPAHGDLAAARDKLQAALFADGLTPLRIAVRSHDAG